MKQQGPKMQAAAVETYVPSRFEEPFFRAPRFVEPEVDDPYFYGWRDVLVTGPDGSEELHQVPLTYEDTLHPQLGDRLSDDSIHYKLTSDIFGILEMRYDTDPSVGVWGNLKIRNPGKRESRRREAAVGRKGPAPDICVIGGVQDRDRRRKSFVLTREPGEIRLTIEVVSESSGKKDFQGILTSYNRLGVREYLAIDPRSEYLAGPIDLWAWRRHPETKRLRRVPLDAEGRFHSLTTGLLFGTGPDGRGLEIREAATGKLLRPAVVEARQQARRAEQEKWRADSAEQRAEQERQRAEQEKQRAESAEQRAEQEKQRAEQEKQRAEQEKQRAEQEKQRAAQAEEGLRHSVEDFCRVLGLAWDTEKSSRVQGMDAARLEALRTHLVREKSWPDLDDGDP